MVTWWTLDISNEAYSANNPFSNGEDIICSFVSVGDKGDQGAQGTTGAQGPAGADNSTQGAQGVQGITGPDNSTQGAQGVQGTIGPDNSTQGAQGVQGTIGPDNSTQGAQGGTGPQGADGEDNSTQGAQGVQGTTGPDNSTQGAQGGTGPQGADGADNSTQGAQGVQGITGPDNSTQGAQGATGPDNSTQGAQGAGGAQGAQGTIGGSGAITAQYTYDQTTTPDPFVGNGNIRFSNSTIASATNAYVRDTDVNGDDWATFYDAIDAVSNTTAKAYMQVSKKSNSSDFILFKITDISDGTNIKTFTIADEAYSSTTPFSNGDSLYLSFSVVGDDGGSGTQGAAGAQGANGAGILQGNVDNNIVTMTGTNAISGSAKFTYDGAGTVDLDGKITIDQQTLGTTGTVAWDPREGSNATIAALTGNVTITLDTTSHWKAGDTGVVRIKQSASTARTVTLTPSSGTNVYLNGSSFSMPSTLSSQVLLGVYFDGTDFYWTIGSTTSLGQKGEPGAQGTNGAQGGGGAQGATGTGTQGATGGDGPQGATGADNSTQGAGGAQGADGPQGADGADNSTQGAQGADGADNSTQGAQGVQGTIGPDNSTQGAQGTTGPDNSTQGAQGAAGTNGTGTQGAQGTDGGSAIVTTYTNGANDRVITSTGTAGINAEANLVFNGDHLTLSSGGLHVGSAVTPATVGKITATNDIVAYATSDKNFKDNIIPIAGSLDKVMKISGVEFDWKPLTDEQKVWLHSNEGHDIGVIAQEIEKVLPEVVTTRENGFKAVRYEKIIPLLIEAIKEQQKQIDSLKNE